MVELSETSEILRRATPRSLIVLDEVSPSLVLRSTFVLTNY